MLTPLGCRATGFGHQTGLGSGREAAACAGAWPLVECLKSSFDEAAAGALDGGNANAQGGDDLRVGRAPRGVQQDAGACYFAGLCLTAPNLSLQRGTFIVGQVNEILLHVRSLSCGDS